MPQMAPLNWLILFLFFIILFILFNIMNYFLFIYKPLKINKTKKSLKINWKW